MGLGEQITLQDAVIGLAAYKEVDERMEQLWHNLDATIVSPRMDRDKPTLPKIQSEGVRGLCTAGFYNHELTDLVARIL